jgi:arylsulfatase
MYLIQAAIFGWTAGLMLGLFDAIMRVSRFLFEWYEIYLALLLPALVLAFFFFIIAVLGSMIPAYRRKEHVRKKVHWSVLIGSLLFALTADRLGGIAGSSELWTEAYILITLLGAALIVLIRNPIVFQVHKGILSSLRLFATAFIIFCLLYDISTFSWRLPERENAGKEDSTPVILITLDTVRARNLAPYGYRRVTTPRLDAFAQESIIFERAYSSSSWTLPSHASIFTGKWIFEHGANTLAQQLRSDIRTLATELFEHGYRTGGFVGGPYAKARYGMAQGFEIFRDRLDFFEWHTLFENYSIRRLLDRFAPNWTRLVLKTDGERTAKEMLPDILQFVDETRGSPFFLFVNFFDAHAPYNLGEEFRPMFGAEGADLDTLDRIVNGQYQDGDLRFSHLTVDEADREMLVNLYDSELYHLDQHLGQFFDHLRAQGLYDRSLIIITSDHGEEFLENGGLQHRQTLFEEVVHVPLYIKPPLLAEELQGTRVSSPVSNKDIFETVLDFSEPSNNTPASLRCYWRFPASCPSKPVFAELYGNRRFGIIDQFAVWQDGYKLLLGTNLHGRLRDGLFDIDVEPREQTDLAQGNPEQARALFEALPIEIQTILINKDSPLPWE